MKTFPCGHEQTHENTLPRDGYLRCRTCRRELERKASKRYRGRRAA